MVSPLNPYGGMFPQELCPFSLLKLLSDVEMLELTNEQAMF